MTLRKRFDLAKQAKGEIQHLYLHWTAGRYQQFFDDYHLSIDGEGQLHQTCNRFTDLKAHTYQRNSGAIGIALCCALDASWNGERPDLGTYPPSSSCKMWPRWWRCCARRWESRLLPKAS